MDFETIVDPEKNEDIHYINFSQDFSCFTVGTEKGYKIFNTLPLLELKHFEGQNNKNNSNVSSTDSLNNFTNSNNFSSNSINNKENENVPTPTKRNSFINSFKNISLKNGTFQQRIKTNSIAEARNNLKKRISINNMNNNIFTPKENKPVPPTLSNCPGLRIVEGLNHSNLLAIVGKDISSYFSPNKVVLCDISNDSVIAEIQYEVEVKAVRLTKYGIIVVLPTQAFIYNGHANPNGIYSIETCYNEKGLVAVANFEKKDSHGITVVLPGKTQGEIQILNLQYKENINSNNAISSSVVSIIPTLSKIRAHKSTLSCLSISHNGELVASASEQGTIIRIFNLETRQKIHEFRRGTDKAQIYCINFNKNANKICVSSNKGTIHIFNLDDNSMMAWQQQQQWNNELDKNSIGYPDGYSTSTMTHYDKNKQQSPLSIYSISQKIAPKYFIERSWAQFRLPLSNICTFVDTFTNQPSSLENDNENYLSETMEPNKVELIALCSNGYLYRFTCITIVKASSSINNNLNENMTLHQTHRIQKKKFLTTSDNESEDEDEEDNDIIENFYNEDYISNE